jgi:hypothetical protein
VERRGEQLAMCSPFFTCKNPNDAKVFHSDAFYTPCGLDSFEILED